MSFTTMTLAFDSMTRLTQGFLGYTSGPMSEIMNLLEKYELDVYCNHPLLLPILMYMVAGSMLQWQLNQIEESIFDVQRQTGLLNDLLTRDVLKFKSQSQRAADLPGETQNGSTQTDLGTRAETSLSPPLVPSLRPPTSPINDAKQNNPQQPSGPINRAQPVPSDRTPPNSDQDPKEEKPNYDRIHQVLIEQHAFLTSGLSQFVEDLGKGCLFAFTNIESSDIGKNILNSTVAHQELHSWMLHLEPATKHKLQHSKALLSRVDMQFQVVSRWDLT
jgi:hypothetical protein